MPYRCAIRHVINNSTYRLSGSQFKKITCITSNTQLKLLYNVLVPLGHCNFPSENGIAKSKDTFTLFFNFHFI